MSKIQALVRCDRNVYVFIAEGKHSVGVMDYSGKRSVILKDCIDKIIFYDPEKKQEIATCTMAEIQAGIMGEGRC